MKILKIYLVDCPNTVETQIYCIKHDNGEDLATLKDKIYIRCPQLKVLQHDPQIYWFDLENDKIIINCDDDLRFFIEESEITKLFWNFGYSQQEMTRKRHLTDDECSESSKRIRKKMEQIDLDSSDSSMDTDDMIENEIENVPVNNVTSTNLEEPVASTSKSNTDSNSPIVNIINVEVIKPVDEVDASHATEKQAENIVVVDEIGPQEISTSDHNSKRQRTESNKIIISDSSDDEEQETQRNNRRYSDGRYTSSSYSFAGANNFRFEQRPSFDDDFRRFHRNHNHFRHRLRDEHIQNMRRIQQNAHAIHENVMRNAETIRENTFRTIRNSANVLPQILSTFQAHFRPLFQQPGFNQQQYSRNFRR